MDGSDTAITIAFDANARERREAANLLVRPPAKAGRGPRFGMNPKRALLGWLIFVGVAAVLFAWLRQSQPAPGPSPRRGTVVRKSDPGWSRPDQIAVGSFAAGAACIVLMFALARRWNRQSRRRWHGRVSLTLDEHGVTQHRPGQTHVLRWIAIRGFEEGRLVFVLRSDKHQGLILPKRLLANEEQRDRLRELLRRHAVRPSVPIPLGFEVAPS